jgi:acyl dehydratase
VVTSASGRHTVARRNAANLERSSRFLEPVYADDTIYPALEVIELTPGRTTGVVTLRSTVHNQRRKLVLEGMQKFLIRRRPGWACGRMTQRGEGSHL